MILAKPNKHHKPYDQYQQREPKPGLNRQVEEGTREIIDAEKN
jgi:hypothetical protein